MSDRNFVHHHDEVQLAKLLKDTKPFLEKYGTTMIYGLAAVLAVAAVIVYVMRQPPKTAEESRLLLSASTSEDFQDIADKVPDTPIGTLARLRQAELSLNNAVSLLFTDREAGVKELDSAAVTYQRLSEMQGLSDSLRERVLTGLARVAESRCDGSDESANAAVEAWQDLLKEFPDSKSFKDIAEDRVKKLQLDSTKSFYAWFHQQNPKPGDDLQLPQDGGGTVPPVPSFEDLEKLNIPLMPADDVPASGSEKSADGAESSATPDGGDGAASSKDEKPESPESAPEKETPASDKESADPKKDATEPEPSPPASEKDSPSPEKGASESSRPSADGSQPPEEGSGDDPESADSPASPEKSGE